MAGSGLAAHIRGPLMAEPKEAVDARDKHGHDQRGLRSDGDFATTFREPDSHGTSPATAMM